jgi:hypothetical protein
MPSGHRNGQERDSCMSAGVSAIEARAAKRRRGSDSTPPRRPEALLRQISAHRELLNDLRTTLSELRKTVSGELHTTGARRTPHQEN